MNTRNTSGTLRFLTIGLWCFFLVGNAVLWLAAQSAPLLLSGMLALLLVASELALLIRYARLLGQWRMVLLSWLGYILTRLATDRLAAIGSPDMATVSALLTLYAMIAGYGALVALGIRRDVSLAYFVLPFAVVPILLQAQIRASGGLLAALWGPALPPGDLAPFTLMEPVVMTTFCIIPLAVLTFGWHFLRLLVKERRRAPLSLP